jgi:hypothetical protein
MIDRTTRQLEALQDYIAEATRDPTITLSAQVARDAAAGDVAARRLVASGFLESSGDRGIGPEPRDSVGPRMPIPSISVAARPAFAMERHARNLTLMAMVRRQRKLAR